MTSCKDSNPHQHLHAGACVRSHPSLWLLSRKWCIVVPGFSLPLASPRASSDARAGPSRGGEAGAGGALSRRPAAGPPCPTAQTFLMLLVHSCPQGLGRTQQTGGHACPRTHFWLGMVQTHTVQRLPLSRVLQLPEPFSQLPVIWWHCLLRYMRNLAWGKGGSERAVDGMCRGQRAG